MKKMRKTAVLVAMAAAAVITAGCSGVDVISDDECLWINAPGP